MEKIKPIKGAAVPPLTPNNAGLDVIRVCKVYDWVVLSESTQQDVIIPGSVTDPTTPLGIISAAIAAGQSVSIQCGATTVPSTLFPLAGGPCGRGADEPVGVFPTTGCYPPVAPYPPCPDTPACTGVLVARNIPVPGAPGTFGAIVKLIQRIPITFNVFVGACPGTTVACPPCPVASFICNVQSRTEVFLCLPEPLDERNVFCRAFNLTCNTSGLIFNGNAIDVEVSICKEVQVEAEVKLEVLAKFAQPRPPITIPPAAICPPIVNFPPQCPTLFPIPNCDCQFALTDTSTTAITVDGTPGVVGTATLAATICPNCNPAGSALNFAFDPAGYYDFGPFTLNFVATTIGAPTGCDPDAAGLIVARVAGRGTFTADGTVFTDVPFTLLVTTIPGVTDCTYLLFINTTPETAPAAIVGGVPVVITPGIEADTCVFNDCLVLPTPV